MRLFSKVVFTFLQYGREPNLVEKSLPRGNNNSAAPRNSFKGIRSLWPVLGVMNADKSIEVIQRKVVKDMEKYFSTKEGFFSKIWLPAILQKSENNF